MNQEKVRIAFIGFGEAGRILGKGLADTGRYDVAAYDLLFDDTNKRTEMLASASASGVRAAASAAEAVAGARVVVSAVTARSARDVARTVAGLIGPERFFMDINSVAPENKKQSAADIEGAGAAYVDAAVMESVPPQGIRVPMLLGGRSAGALKSLLDPAGMNLEVVSDEIGVASAIKMCRSVMIKGLEALSIECLLTARRYGVEERVIASLDKTFPSLDWNRQGNYLMSRVVKHGTRRAAEMREVAVTLRDVGLDPLMVAGTVERQQWVADLATDGTFQGVVMDAFSWRDAADAIVGRQGPGGHAAIRKSGSNRGNGESNE